MMRITQNLLLKATRMTALLYLLKYFWPGDWVPSLASDTRLCARNYSVSRKAPSCPVNTRNTIINALKRTEKGKVSATLPNLNVLNFPIPCEEDSKLIISTP